MIFDFLKKLPVYSANPCILRKKKKKEKKIQKCRPILEHVRWINKSHDRQHLEGTLHIVEEEYYGQ